MPYLARNTELGELEVLEVYEYYDIPRLFLCINQYEQLYLALSIDETDECLTWLYAPVTKNRLKQIRTGAIDLHDAFKLSEEKCVFQITTLRSGPDHVSTVMCDDLQRESLPYQGPKLDIPKSRAIPKSSHELAMQATQGSMQETVDVEEIIIKAFSQVRNCWSVDRVIADPHIGPLFIEKCTKWGLKADPAYLNLKLMRLRKAGKLKHLPKSKRNGLSTGTDSIISFASELAYRLLRLKKGVSLDQILCNPILVREFDTLAERMSPGYSTLDYRLSALNVRKRGRYKTDEKVEFGSAEHVKKIGLDTIPEAAGLYLFSSDDRPIFINQTDNLKKRLTLHLENSDNMGLPQYAWSKPLQFSHIETVGATNDLRKSLEQTEILRRETFLNFYSLDKKFA